MKEARLVTVPFSHFCEKARWALDRTLVPYREEGHLPAFHILATLRLGAGATVPVLQTEEAILSDSTDILKYADERADVAERLFPGTSAARRECEWLEDAFDRELGPESRRLAYFYLLPDTAKCIDAMQSIGPRWERRLVGPLFPFLRTGMRRRMEIDAEGVRLARTRIAAVFAEVAKRLSDGRHFLLGARFSAADLTFAALAAPLVQPREHGFPLPPLETLGEEMQAQVKAFRATIAGSFALRLYAEERRR